MEPKTLHLKDGTEVVVRLMTMNDMEKAWSFFQKLPKEDRIFLRYDVTKRPLFEKHMRDIESGEVKRVIALVGDEIVGDGALELAGTGWKEHVAELRLVVARECQRKGLGLVLARELYTLASLANVEEVVVKMMRPQVAARAIFTRLGFREQIVLPDYVKDLTGRRQDMMIMRSNLGELWREMEERIDMSDWQSHR